MNQGVPYRGLPGWNRALLRAWTLLFAALWLAGRVSTAGSASAVAGRNWLLARQTAAGLWSAATSRRIEDSLAAAQALDVFESTRERAAALKARGALLLALDPGSPLVPDRLAAFLCNAADTGNTLLAAQNPDGGWPMAAGQQSDVLDTAVVAAALAARDALPADAAHLAAVWLTSHQQADGLWTLSPDGGPGRLELSARAVRALDSLRHAGLDAGATLMVDNAIEAALASLRQSFRTDGRFSLDSDLSRPVSVTGTAETYRTLVQFDPPGLYSNTLLLLETLQAPDGHWSEPGNSFEDVYATATVLEALRAVRVPPRGPQPNFFLTPSGVWFTPGQPQAGQRLHLHAIVFNTGSVATPQTSVAFFRGDPRCGGIQIGESLPVPSIPAGGSAYVQTELDTANLDAISRIFICVDLEQQVAESNETDNLVSRPVTITGITPAAELHGPNLHLSPICFLFNGIHSNTVQLTAGPVIEVGILLENTGDAKLPQTQVAVWDGETLVARLSAPSVPPRGTAVLRFPWAPAPGRHGLHCVGDSNESVPETDESDNHADYTLHVLGSTNRVAVERWIGGTGHDPPCRAYDNLRITATSAYPNALIRLRLYDPNGGAPEFAPVPLAIPAAWQWNTGNAPPGTYTVQARYLSPQTGTLLARTQSKFDLLPTIALRGLRVILSKSVIEPGTTDPIPVSVILENGANQDAQWLLTWRVLDPAASEVEISSTGEKISLPAKQLSRLVSLQQAIPAPSGPAGRYTVEVTASQSDGTFTARGAAHFTLLPVLHLGLHNEVIPTEVLPLGKARVRTIVRLSAGRGGDSPDIPVEIRKIEVRPARAISDDGVATAIISASQIVNSVGQPVPDGAFLAVRTLYGTITSGIPAPEAAPEAGVRILALTGAAVQVEYTPAGTALSTLKPLDENSGGQWDPNDPNQPGGGGAEYSVAIVRFYQYFPGQKQWLGKNIANAEVFLEKP